MKTVSLRFLGQKPELTKIVTDYMARPSVSTGAFATAVELIVFDFAHQEKSNREYRQRAEEELRALRARVEELTLELGDEVTRRRNFIQAFDELTRAD